MIPRRTCNTSLYLRRCKFKHCKTENLGGAMAHLCCIELLNIQGKLVFDGSIENLDYIIHDREDLKDFDLINYRILEAVTRQKIS